MSELVEAETVRLYADETGHRRIEINGEPFPWFTDVQDVVVTRRHSPKNYWREPGEEIELGEVTTAVVMVPLYCLTGNVSIEQGTPRVTVTDELLPGIGEENDQ